MARTDWSEMLRTGVALGLAPEAFWRLSVKEWRMLTSVTQGGGPMERSALDALMRNWPD